MTTDQNKAVVARFNKEFIEGGNRKAFDEIIAPDFINHSAPEGSPKGPEGIVYFFDHLLKPAFHNLKVVIHDQVAEGDKVTTRKSFHAIHKGDFFGAPASGQKVVMEVIDIIKLRDGKFVEHWNVLDWQSVMMQITAKQTV